MWDILQALGLLIVFVLVLGIAFWLPDFIFNAFDYLDSYISNICKNRKNKNK